MPSNRTPSPRPQGVHSAPGNARTAAVAALERGVAWIAFASAAILAALALALGTAAMAQEDSPPEPTDGRIPAFQITERTETPEVGVTIQVVTDAQGTATPQVLVAGPGGTLVWEAGSEVVFESLPQGDYLVAATAPGQRVASGTLRASDGDVVTVSLTLFDMRVQFADEADTPLLGIFTMDVADTVAEGKGELELIGAPSGKMAVIGSDGYLEVFITAAERRVLEGLEAGRYVAAITVEERVLTAATVTIEADQRVTVEAQLEAERN